MSEGGQMSRSRSFMWGTLTWFLGMVLANFVPIPFIGFIVAGLLYFLYLRKNGIKLGWFALGYFSIVLVLVAIFGLAIITILFGGSVSFMVGGVF